MDPRAAPEILDLLDRVVRRKRAELTALARREGLAAEDAVDCVHDAFCTFLQIAQRGELPDGLERPDEPELEAEQTRYLQGIVRNAARNKRRRHHLALPHQTIDAIEPGDENPSSEILLAHAEECVRLRSCVNKLCESQRTVVMMRLLEERPGEDVATTLGLTRGHVDVLLHRAKSALLVCMREEG
jgi:RNA polymerase sigma-70 factor (ECF subfamily)